MRIALVTETFLPSTDGIVTRFLHAIDYLREEGHDILIIAPDIEGLPSEYNGARVIGSTALTFSFYKQRPWSTPSRKVKKYLQDFDPDIVHAVNPFSLAASGVRYSKKLDIPLICSFHTNMPKYMDHYHLGLTKPVIWSYLRKLHNSAPINLVTSQAMYEELDQQDIQGLEILPKGVDLENRNPKFYSNKMRERLTNGQTDKTLLIFIGRLAPEKEIASLKSMLEEREDVCLAIVGDGPEKEQLEETFKDLPVVFTGFLHDEELSQAYASADAFIFPSITETLGLVILEAMASGTPVIAAYSKPTVEQITHEENGLIYDRGSLDSLFESIDQLSNKNLVEELVDNGLDYAEQFSWENASKAIEDAYVRTVEIYENIKV